MFSTANDASKVAFITLSKKLEEIGFELIDGQVYSPHLETLGFNLVPRKDFVNQLSQLTKHREKNTL